MTAATLNGHRVTHARVSLPAFGIWWAEASLDEEVSLSGRASLVIADLALSGTIMSSGIGPAGRSSCRIAGGAGAWGKSIASKSYANDAGVAASMVLSDAAKDCGETIDLSGVSLILGPSWTREAAEASQTLELIFPGGWYVGEDGKTRIGRRVGQAFAGVAQVSSVDRAFGAVQLAAESIATLVPGVTVEGIEAADVLHELEPGALRTTLWGTGIASANRRVAAYRRIFELLDPRRRFRGVYEYRVVTQSGERLNLQPIRVSTGMPDLQRVPVRPGIPGAKATHALGSRVLVTFIDGEPSRPVVVGFEDAEGGGYVATMLELAGAGALPAARQTDGITAGPWVGTITGPCSTKVKVA